MLGDSLARHHRSVRSSLLLVVLCASALNAGVARAQCMAAGDACDDGQWCTVTDRCDTTLTCVGQPRDCLDGVACTDDVCNEATDTCDHPPRPMGTECTDGAFCTDGDVCDGAGLCMAGPRRGCVDGLSCTIDRCNDTDDVCENPIRAGACLIDGTCRYDGEPNPDVPCELCVPDTLPDGWSAAPAGASCGMASCADGVRTDQLCDATGVCGPATVACDFGVCQDDTSCATCSVDEDCEPDSYCAGTECSMAGGVGAVCDRDRRCLSGHCDDTGQCAASAAPDGGAGDAGDGGTGNIVAHGSGCVACTVGAAAQRAPWRALVSFLTFSVLILRRRRGH